MKDLEKLFKDHRDQFDDSEPLDDHFENFLGKMNSQKRKSTFTQIPNLLKVAAVVVFVIFSGIVGYQIKSLQGNQLGLGAISPEYREVEHFYTSNINSQLCMLQELGKFDSNQHQNILSEELEEMDERYLQLKKELEMYPDDERIIQAMIEYYQVKTNVLNRIIEQLYEIKKQKSTNLNTSV